MEPDQVQHQDDSQWHVCLICKNREVRQPFACDRCRAGLDRDLRDVGQLYLVLPAAVAPERGTQEGIPIVLQTVDLGLPARMVTGGKPVHDDYGDQHGAVPAAAVLDSWVRDWAETRDELAPAVEVPGLVDWLRDRARFAWACESHMAIDEFAREVRTLAAAMRRALNLDATPKRYTAECPHCLTRSLRKYPGSIWVECAGRAGCGRLWDEEEYAALARNQVPATRPLTTGQAAIYASVEPGTIRTWAHRAYLAPCDRDRRGWPLYLRSDVDRAIWLVGRRLRRDHFV